MPVFAKVSLVVTLCTSGAVAPGVPSTDNCRQEVPHTWASANIIEARQDWDACKGRLSAYPSAPGVPEPFCRYTELAGG